MARDKSIKNDGSYLFADFSRGLYLLDTPRFITEQLASLALVDGRNVWAEKGALVPQYGYELRATLPPSYDGPEGTLPPMIKGISKGDSSNDDFMILANEFMEMFDSSVFTITGTPTLSSNGILSNISTSDYASLDSSLAFGNNFEIEFAFTTGSDLTASQAIVEGATNQYLGLRIADGKVKLYVGNGSIWTVGGVSGVTSLTANTKYYNKFTYDGENMVWLLSQDEENWTTEMTVAYTSNLPTFLLRFGITRDAVYAFGGTIDLNYLLIKINDEVVVRPEREVEAGRVYLYSASQGLKRFKTALANIWSDTPILTRRGKDLCIYDDGVFRLWGGNYIEEAEETVAIGTYNILAYTSYIEFNCSEDDAMYFWNGKQVLIDDSEYVITACFKARGATTYTVRAYNSDEGEIASGNQTIYECATWATTLVYKPDNTGIDPPKPDISLTPRMMGVAMNRLFVENIDGSIYYSSVGLVNDFDETNGAGYFSGFYNDTTKLLSIEDFLNNALITKENGMYSLSITTDGVQINKISQVGQEYPSDHVIVGEKVYAYDKNLGGIVNAIQVNVFGSMVSGKPLVTSEYLNVQNFNINTTKRALVYNAETQILVLYYGENLDNGLVYTMNDGRLFPRQLDKSMIGYIGFNQGVCGVSRAGNIIQDFKKGTIIPNLTCVASFEPIGIRDNRFITSTILEVTELNGIDYTVTTQNAGSSYQVVTPSFYVSSKGVSIPPFLYSDSDYLSDSFELTSRWAEQNSHMTRIYAPMSGRSGVSITLEFEPDKAFILSTLRLPDFSQGN